MTDSRALKARLEAAATALRRAIESTAEAERISVGRLQELPGVAMQLDVLRAATAAAVSADMAAQRTFAAIEASPPGEDAALDTLLAFSAATDAVGHAADAAARALTTLTGLVNQRFKYEKKPGRR